MEVDPQLTHDDLEDIEDAKKRLWAHLKRQDYTINTAINTLIHTIMDILLDAKLPPVSVMAILSSISQDYAEKYMKENP